MMSFEVVRNLVGKSVKDIYGRYAGCVIGLSVDTLGHLKAIGVDEGMGNFAEYPSSRLLIDNDSLIIIPAWKMDIERLKKERIHTELRTKALEELQRAGEIPPHVYRALSEQYKAEYEQLLASYESLKETLEKRVEELNRQKEGLERFLGAIKVQYKAGEIDEETYRATSESIQSLLEKDEREKRDIEETLESLKLPWEKPQQQEPALEEVVPASTTY